MTDVDIDYIWVYILYCIIVFLFLMGLAEHSCLSDYVPSSPTVYEEANEEVTEETDESGTEEETKVSAGRDNNWFWF